MIEDFRVNQEEDTIEEVDSCNGDVECIRFLVHPRSQDADTDKEAGLNDKQCDSLCSAATLCEGNEDCLDQYVDEDRHDEIVGCSAKLNIEETPFVQCRRVRVKNVSRILVHLDGPFGDSPDL